MKDLGIILLREFLTDGYPKGFLHLSEKDQKTCTIKCKDCIVMDGTLDKRCYDEKMNYGTIDTSYSEGGGYAIVLPGMAKYYLEDRLEELADKISKKFSKKLNDRCFIEFEADNVDDGILYIDPHQYKFIIWVDPKSLRIIKKIELPKV